MPICFVYHFYYKTNKKKLIDSRSTNHAEKRRFDPSHNSAVCFTGTVWLSHYALVLRTAVLAIVPRYSY